MPGDEYAQLQLRVMAAAQMYGCEAVIREADRPKRGTRATVAFNVVVTKHAPTGKLNTITRSVCLPHGHLAEAIARIVRNAAMELPDADS